ncbi:unnamed protein product [Heterobilharzia americana]|nr:unnamed protein product [Heterobilharzia americana]
MVDMRSKLDGSDGSSLGNSNLGLPEINKCGSTNCECKTFQPILSNIRQCTNCHHSWCLHVLPKLVNLPMYFETSNSPQPLMLTTTLELLSMSLFGCQAIPMRIKILLDRLLSAQLAHADVVRILLTFGWTFQDYSRGYMLTNSNGSLKDHWEMCTVEEESVVIQQFLRFPETRQLAYIMLSQGCSEYEQKTSSTTVTSNQLISGNYSQSTFTSHLSPLYSVNNVITTIGSSCISSGQISPDVALKSKNDTKCEIKSHKISQ